MGTSLEAEQLLSIAVTVTSEQRVESVLQRTVQGLAAQPGVALTRIWLLPSIHLPSPWRQSPDAPEGMEHLHLVASAGTPINSPGEDWSFLQGHFARFPMHVGKVGQVAAERHPILIKDVAYEDSWIIRPEWAKREGIRSFAGYPLVFRDNLLGVIAVFSRRPLEDQEFAWLGLFANHAAVAIANTRAFEDLKRAEEALRSNERNLSLIINTIPTTAWTTRPDGYCDFLNQRWLDYAGMTAEQAAGWGWAEAIHPDDRQGLVEFWQSSLASGVPVEAEARMRRFDGSYRWFLFRANPVRGESGEVVKWYGINIDIEDRKRGEEALRANELSWREIVDNIPGLVATMGAMGEVEFLNRQTLEYFGKTNEELKDWALIDAVHPDDLPRVIEARQESIEAGGIYDVEHRCRRADGIYRWFQVRGLPVRNAEGTITAWYLLLTDIDDRKKAEEALRSSERNLSLIINTIPTFIHVLRTDGSVQYVNQAVLDYHGCTLEDVQKEDYRARFFHPEDVERLREQRREALTRAVPFENEQRVLGKDGRYHWFFIRYNPLLDEQGRIDRWYVAGLDIEDRKLAEAQVEQAYVRLAQAQRLSKTGSFITDLLVDEHNWSEELCRIFEFDPGTRVTTEAIRAAFHPEDLPVYEDAFKRAVAGLDQEIDITYRIITPAGNVKHLHAVTHIMEKIAGRPVYIGAIQDVTESKLAEEALTRARMALAHMARVTTLSALTTSIAHEVNQPISAVITSAGACLRWLNRDQPEVQRAREAAMRIEEDGKRAAEIITHLKSFYKKEVSPQRELVSVNDLVGEMLVLLRSEADRHSMVMRTEPAAALPSVSADRVLLQQVLMNLMLNGMEATSEPGGELKVSTRREGGEVMVSVSDTGVGIPAAKLEEIFNAFVTTKAGGTGMGLAISRTIIESHGGRLWATVNPGRGATFHFTLPTEPEA